MTDSDREVDEAIEAVVSESGTLLGRFFAFGFVLLLMAAVGVFTTAFLIHGHVTRPGLLGERVPFEVPEGASGNEIAALLADAEFIEHPLFFRLALRLDDSRETIKHGTHSLPEGASPMELLALLREIPAPEVDPDAIRVTIPEGLTINQIAQELADIPDFLAAAAVLEPFAELGVDVPTLDGFLMPNTYYFSEPPDGAKLVRTMLDQFKADYTELLDEFPAMRDEHLVRIVTIASLIEEEARVDEERPLVSAVIYNRLAQDRPLQLDSTLQYALNKYGQRLLNSDKEVESPYNTYQRRGLPPGPISNPGVASLRAAMAPADVEYVYFVSNADGKTHTFSTTLAEHERAVAQYRREIREQRRELEQQ